MDPDIRFVQESLDKRAGECTPCTAQELNVAVSYLATAVVMSIHTAFAAETRRQKGLAHGCGACAKCFCVRA